jgi:hypothetical protein
MFVKDIGDLFVCVVIEKHIDFLHNSRWGDPFFPGTLRKRQL